MAETWASQTVTSIEREDVRWGQSGRRTCDSHEEGKGVTTKGNKQNLSPDPLQSFVTMEREAVGGGEGGRGGALNTQGRLTNISEDMLGRSSHREGKLCVGRKTWCGGGVVGLVVLGAGGRNRK